MVSDGTCGLIQGPVGFTYVFHCAVVGWAFPVVDYISFLCIWNWMFWMHDKDLMVLVPLKKTPTLYFARMCLHCSLRPLMYGMTILGPPINFPVDGIGFLLAFCWVLLVERSVLGSSCLADRKYLSFKFFGLLISSLNRAEEGTS